MKDFFGPAGTLPIPNSNLSITLKQAVPGAISQLNGNEAHSFWVLLVTGPGVHHHTVSLEMSVTGSWMLMGKV